jgi:hypothetical protein
MFQKFTINTFHYQLLSIYTEIAGVGVSERHLLLSFLFHSNTHMTPERSSNRVNKKKKIKTDIEF